MGNLKHSNIEHSKSGWIIQRLGLLPSTPTGSLVLKYKTRGKKGKRTICVANGRQRGTSVKKKGISGGKNRVVDIAGRTVSKQQELKKRQLGLHWVPGLTTWEKKKKGIGGGVKKREKKKTEGENI